MVVGLIMIKYLVKREITQNAFLGHKIKFQFK